ncbi:MAG: hypothetical protein M3O70_09940 [Actinomycetota bacterium]|nr:hypothetical protein [Actinomycetota bacterium]
MTTDPREGATAPSWDEALERLEDFVNSYPLDRALPDLAGIVAQARVPRRFLREDERARKVLLEAIAARPLSSLEQVGRVRTEVELLILEVEMLAERLASTALTAEQTSQVSARLDNVRARLVQIRTQL